MARAANTKQQICQAAGRRWETIGKQQEELYGGWQALNTHLNTQLALVYNFVFCFLGVNKCFIP